jgi:hypothetical protein
MYFSLSAANDLTGERIGGTRYNSWGETRYLTEEDWGTGGSKILGTNIRSLGTRITDGETYGFALSMSNLTEYVNGGIYSMSWYQPAYASSYGEGLRRYNGGGLDATRVRGYCVAARSLTYATLNTGAGDIVPASGTGISGIVTLAGASALVASAVAFGITSLAF